MFTYISVITLSIIAICYNLYWHYSQKPKNIMSFKESLDLADLPIVTFYQGENKFNFLLDTGSTMNIINSNSSFTYTELKEQKGTVTGVGGTTETTYAELSLFYKKKEFITTTQVMDLADTFNTVKQETGVTLHGILGNNFFSKYGYVLNYYDMIAYSKK